MRVCAEVVEWQTRTFKGRVAKAVRVQVPPSAPTFIPVQSITRYLNLTILPSFKWENFAISMAAINWPTCSEMTCMLDQEYGRYT